MKVTGTLYFNVKLEAILPDTGFLGLVNPDAILKRASTMIAPVLHSALRNVFSQLAILGVQIRIIESAVNITQE